jgi:divalent anion:Na+ symporter, DASS family
MVRHLLNLKPLQGVQLKAFLGVLAVGFILTLIPHSEAISPQAWNLFCIFIATIVGAMIKPLPMGGLAILAVTVCVITKTVTINQALSQLSSPVVWLIVLAFFISKAFIKTGLGNRIAYFFISHFGKSTLGLSYSLVITETFLSPFIPSNTARGAGISFPLFKSLAEGYGSTPEKFTERKIGSFLCLICYHTNVITSALFLTAMAGNPLILGIAKTANIHITWSNWFMALFVPGMVHLMLFPLIIYYLYPPELKHTPEAPQQAREKAQKMGPLTRDEKIMLSVFGLLLGLWVFGHYIGIGATETGLIGTSVLLITGVLSWDDIANEKEAWMTLIWFSVLLMMGHYLNEFGLTKWVGLKMGGLVHGWSWFASLVLLGSIYLFIHYFFTNLVAHITAFYATFLLILIQTGAPPLGAALYLAAFSSLSGSLTHYSTAPAVIFFGSGYVDTRNWWIMGFLVALLGLGIWFTVGFGWFKVLGLF